MKTVYKIKKLYEVKWYFILFILEPAFQMNEAGTLTCW